MADQSNIREEEEPYVGLLELLDSHAILNILRLLDVRSLAAFATVSRAAYAYSKVDMLWLQHLWDSFGLLRPAPGVSPRRQYLALLEASKLRGTVLPWNGAFLCCKAEESWDDYGPRSLFQVSPRTIFCSGAGKHQNVHGFGILSCSEDNVVALLEGADVEAWKHHRNFMLDRCQYPAAFLLPELGLMMQAQDMSQAQPAPLPTPSAEQLARARAVLEQCTTRGIEDLFLHIYHRLAVDNEWGRLLEWSLTTDVEKQEMHQCAWAVWHGHTRPRLSTPEPLPNSDVLQLYHARECSALLSPKLNSTVGLFREVVLDRHQNVTCPMRVGCVFAGVVPPVAPATSGPAQAGAFLRDRVQEPFLKVLTGVTTAREVAELSDAGSLPPIFEYRRYSNGEAIEFCRQPYSEAQARLHGEQGPAWLHPVVWFRFYTAEERKQLQVQSAAAGGGQAPQQQQQEEEDQAPQQLPFDDDDIEYHGEAPFLVQGHVDVIDTSGSEDGSEDRSEDGSEPREDEDRAVQPGEVQPGPSTSGGVQRPPLELVDVVPGHPLATPGSFPASRNLTACAPEVAYSFQWGIQASSSTASMMHLRLAQPWCACVLGIKLIENENLRPAYNVQRGGQNLDAAYVGVVGHRVHLGE